MTKAEQLRDAILAQNPTTQQKEAIFAKESEFLLRAAPGSGKTWTSCRRFIWRAANWSHPAGGLALLSFTNAAIREFKEATINAGESELLTDPNFVGTFDSFIERYILTPFGHLLTGANKRPKLFPGPRPSDWKNKQLISFPDGNHGSTIPVRAWDVIPYPDGSNNNFYFKSSAGQRLPVTNGFNAVRHLLSLGFYTHAQRTFWACKLLTERPHIARVLGKRFPEIIVDEAQDTSAWLLILLNLLRDNGAKITLIGDPDQCIFEFSMANATSLEELKTKWSIPNKPLSQSFRCNNHIAAAVRKLGGNAHFDGNGKGASEWHRGFVVKESSNTFADSLSTFQRLICRAGLDLDSAAIVSRGHQQLESLYGKANYTSLRGKTETLATAAFFRDSRHEYRRASQAIEKILRELTGDDPLWEGIDSDSNSFERMTMALAIWKFVKRPDRLLPLSKSCDEWIPSMRTQLTNLIEDLGFQCEVKLGRHVKSTGISGPQRNLPLFESTSGFLDIRQDTIHKVKGESIDSVLVIGSTNFWNSVVSAVCSGNNTEARRLAYVAMTRARHLLVVALPEGHFNKHSQTWIDWGFRIAT